MDKITLKPTDVHTIPLGLKRPDGTVEPIPAGDVFNVVSSLPAVVPGSIGSDPATGSPSLVINALTLPSAATETGIVLTVSDSAGDTVLELGVDYPEPVAPGQIAADLAADTVTTQAAPTAAGP